MSELNDTKHKTRHSGYNPRNGSQAQVFIYLLSSQEELILSDDPLKEHLQHSRSSLLYPFNISLPTRNSHQSERLRVNLSQHDDYR